MLLGIGGDPAKAMAAPRHALQRKLLEGLRYLLRAHLLSQGVEGIPSNNTAVFDVLQEHGIAQPTPEGKAIWKATVVSLTGWSNSFTFLRLSPALIWEPGERPEPFAGSLTVDGSAKWMQQGNFLFTECPIPLHILAADLGLADAGAGIVLDVVTFHGETEHLPHQAKDQLGHAVGAASHQHIGDLGQASFAHILDKEMPLIRCCWRNCVANRRALAETTHSASLIASPPLDVAVSR